MHSALLGSTGFVGSNLADARHFDEHFNSRTIGDVAGRRYDLVYAAATRADSHRINQDGAADRAEIDALVDTLARAEIGHLVLISTVCVYPAGTSPDEDTPREEAGLTPYGANRLHMERRLGDLFETTVVRLPQLYGAHLKKGVVHDLLRDHRVEHIAPDDSLQHYDVRGLAADIDVIRAAGLTSWNVATAPLRNDRLAAEVFGRDIAGNVPPGAPSPFSRMYSRDMRTRHAALFGGADGFVRDAEATVAGLRAFVAEAEAPGA